MESQSQFSSKTLETSLRFYQPKFCWEVNFWSSSLNLMLGQQWRIQDFPERDANLGGLRQPIIWPMSLENCMKMKTFWVRGGRPSRPLNHRVFCRCASITRFLAWLTYITGFVKLNTDYCPFGVNKPFQKLSEPRSSAGCYIHLWNSCRQPEVESSISQEVAT